MRPYFLWQFLQDGDINSAEELLKKHPTLDVNICHHGLCPIHLAVQHRDAMKFVKILCAMDIKKSFFSGNKSPAVIALEYGNYPALIYFMEHPVINEFLFQYDFDYAFFLLLKGKQWELAKALLKLEHPRLPNGTEYIWNSLHILVEEEHVDMEIFAELLRRKPIFGCHIDGKNELDRALKHPNRTVLKSLLTHGSASYQLATVECAIQQVMDMKAEEKTSTIEESLHFVDCVVKCRGRTQEKITANTRLIKTVINRCTHADDIVTLIEKLDETEKQRPFFTVHHQRYTLFSYSWQGETVSRLWMEIIECAKTKILDLTNQTADAVFSVKTYYFLQNPTTKWDSMFNATTAAAKKYLELTTKKLPSLDFGLTARGLG